MAKQISQSFTLEMKSLAEKMKDCDLNNFISKLSKGEMESMNEISADTLIDILELCKNLVHNAGYSHFGNNFANSVVLLTGVISQIRRGRKKALEQDKENKE